MGLILEDIFLSCALLTEETGPERLTNETDDAATLRDAAALTAGPFGPRDSVDENPPQGQKYLETRVRQTHSRVTSPATECCFPSERGDQPPGRVAA